MRARCTVVALMLLVPAATEAQALVDKVPADTIWYLGWRGADDLGPQYGQSNLKAVLDDSNIPEFLNDFLPRVMNRLGKMDPDAGKILPIVGAIASPSWHHPTAFFAGIEIDQGGQPQPKMGVIWQAQGDADNLANQLQKLVQNANAPFPIKVFHQGPIVALTVGYADAAAALAGGDVKALGNEAAFSSAMQHVGKEPAVVFYADYQREFALLDKVLKEQGGADVAAKWPKIRDTLGLGSLKRIIVASGFDGKDWATQGFIEAPAPRTGLFKIFGEKPVGPELLSAIPATATMAGAGRCDLSVFVQLIRDTIAAADENTAKQVDDFLDSINQQSGVDIQKDLIGSLSDEWAYYADPQIGGRGLTGITLVNHLKDPTKFEESLARIEDFALQQISSQLPRDAKVNIRFYTTKVDGTTIHYLGVPVVAPSWVVKDGNLYVTLFPQVAAGAARVMGEHRANVTTSACYQMLRQRLGAQAAQAADFSFSDLPRTAPDAYPTWLMITRLAGFGDIFGIKSPPFILPELSKLQSHLAPAVGACWFDQQGIHFRSVEPFPGSTLVASDPQATMLAAAPLWIGITLPALNRAREQANRVKSASNLRQIGFEAMMYANENRGKMPPDLATLYNRGELNASVFLSPDSEHPQPIPQPKPDAQWVQEHSDYVWVGAGKTADARADEVLAYEKARENADGLNILYGDGHVDFVPMAEAQRQIDQAQKQEKRQ